MRISLIGNDKHTEESICGGDIPENEEGGDVSYVGGMAGCCFGNRRKGGWQCAVGVDCYIQFG